MKKVGFNCLVGKVSTLADGSVKVEVVTSKELSDSDAAILLGLRRAEGYVMFAAERIQEEDLTAKPVKVPLGKTPSQRLRHHLYRLWEQGEQLKDFQSYYEHQISVWCERISQKLDEGER